MFCTWDSIDSIYCSFIKQGDTVAYFFSSIFFCCNIFILKTPFWNPMYTYISVYRGVYVFKNSITIKNALELLHSDQLYRG